MPSHGVIRDFLQQLVGTDAESHSQILGGAWGTPQKGGRKGCSEGFTTPGDRDSQRQEATTQPT